MKNVSDLTEQFDRCLMNEPAFCTAVCPFGFDARTFTEKIRQGRLSAAYKQYRDTVVFPEIVSRLCDRPCEAACPLGEIDHPIDLKGLERLVTEAAKDEAPESYNLPSRGKRICIIGAGLSGLACTLKLAQKKYDVTVFEAAGAINAAIAGETFDQLRNESYTLHTGMFITSMDEFVSYGFDAVYIATGEGGEHFGLPVCKGYGLYSEDSLPSMIIPHIEISVPGPTAGNNLPETGRGGRGGLHDLAAEAGVCLIAGGAIAGRRDVYAIADGILAATAIDAFLRTGLLQTTRPPRRTATVLAPVHLERYRAGAAASEAARCLGCRCDACMVYCDLPAYTGKWPPRIRDEVFATTLPGRAEVKATPAKRLINIDNLSGVFADVCPVHIDLDALLLAGRQSMHRQGKMPWAFHEFWLRDMAHANDGKAALVLSTQSNKQTTSALDTRSNKRERGTAVQHPLAFFPGCQLGAASPGLVGAAWNELQELNAMGHIVLSGLILRCCGAPAEWAGDETLFQAALDEVRGDWDSLSRPALACACPTCMRVLGKYLPEIETVSIYEVLMDCRSSTDMAPRGNVPAIISGNPAGTWAVFDPCAAARLQDESKSKALRQSVRGLAAEAGLCLDPLPIQENILRCCGFGGQPECADPSFVSKVRDDRASESDLPYLCYCMNCREAFLKAGKNSAHILELLYTDAAATVAPQLSPSARRKNREALRYSLAGSQRGENAASLQFTLEYADGVLSRMDEDKILSEDVCAVIDHIRLTKQNALNTKTGVRSGSFITGRTTCWVGYIEKESANSLTVTAVYAHRLAIELEDVWAGVRRGADRQEIQKEPGPPLSSSVAIEDSGMIHEQCNSALKEMEAEFSYLGRSFRQKVMRCPACGFVYIPEELARGRMREVEMALEDK